MHIQADGILTLELLLMSLVTQTIYKCSLPALSNLHRPWSRFTYSTLGFKTLFPPPAKPHMSLTLYNIFRSPSIIKNLINVFHFTKYNIVYFLFNFNECLAKSQETKKIFSNVVKSLIEYMNFLP